MPPTAGTTPPPVGHTKVEEQHEHEKHAHEHDHAVATTAKDEAAQQRPTVTVKTAETFQVDPLCPYCGESSLTITGQLSHDRWICNTCNAQGPVDELLEGSKHLEEVQKELQDKIKAAKEREANAQKVKQARAEAAKAAEKAAAEKEKADKEKTEKK